MVRRGWSTAATIAVATCVLAACSDDAGGPTTSSFPTATSGPPATLPADVAPGEGALALGDDLFTLTVTCELEPTTDATTGVTTQLIADGGDPAGAVVTVVRQSTVGDVPTVTDTVAVQAEGVSLESQRVDAGGQLIDLRLPNPVERLIEVEESDTGTLVRAQGVFGPSASLADDPANLDGSLLFRCPA